MTVYKAKLLDAIQYTGEEPKAVRELLTNPVTIAQKGDVLIVPEKVAKFLSRAGSPFERFDFQNFIKENENDLVNQVSDDAVAVVNQLNQTVLELESQLKLKQDELDSYELREHQEMEELKRLNQELNDKLELSKVEVITEVESLNQTVLETEDKESKGELTAPKTSKKRTTKHQEVS